jgi:hypothetical protein
MKDRNAPQSVLDGTVIGRNMQRHRHQAFICFPNGWGTRSPRSSGTTVFWHSGRPESTDIVEKLEFCVDHNSEDRRQPRWRIP